MCTKAVSLSTVLSNDLASLRDRLSHPKVRSTIQRFFCNTNFPRGRVTISTTHSHRIHAQSTTDLYAVSAQMTFGNFTNSWNASKASFAPSRSCTSAGVTTNAQTNPRVSVTICRLRPSVFFPRIVASWPALFGRLNGLAIQNGCGGFGRSAFLSTNSVAEFLVQPFPSAIRLPSAKPVKDNSIRRKVVGQATPSTAIACDVKDRVDNFTLGILRWATCCRVVR